MISKLNDRTPRLALKRLCVGLFVLSCLMSFISYFLSPPLVWAEKDQGFHPKSFLKSNLAESGQAVADVAEWVAPSVVNIDVEKTRPAFSSDMGFPFGDEMLKRFFGFEGGASPGVPSRVPKKTLTGNGSGVVWDKAGHILTNNHVIQGAEKITVTFQDGQAVAASLLGVDPYSDLAILKLEGPNIPQNIKPASLGNSQILRPGEFVLAIGSPLGFDHTVTLGIISAKSRKVPDINHNVEFIQTDAAINPGNSGGPLVNLKGEVVGINTAISGLGQNIGFAIPVDTVKAIAQTLIAEGTVQRPWLGIAMTDLNPVENPELAKSLGIPESTTGVVVSQVMAGSPAATAGFQVEDVIQRLNGKKVDSAKAIQKEVQTLPIQSPMTFQVLRGGKLLVLKTRTEALPNPLNKSQTSPAKPSTPAKLRSQTEQPSKQSPKNSTPPFFGQEEAE
jgi:serine protease Do